MDYPPANPKQVKQQGENLVTPGFSAADHPVLQEYAFAGRGEQKVLGSKPSWVPHLSSGAHPLGKEVRNQREVTPNEQLPCD